MTPITYKLALDKEGTPYGIELWQDGQHVTVSTAAAGTHRNGWRWIEVKETINKLTEELHERSKIKTQT